ncbi:PaaI family thioesterase [Pseudomonas entomophila]|uniref:PaaI family thioesterase n=1 Tax=Pseudomonas entomophila TaxID=312306 RepID=UPI001BCC104E|nr:PaaI family thioesterase [Pseudomonas entomophila]QVM89640.1 PaaI family thioesterase [Pseudomonas entomophila]
MTEQALSLQALAAPEGICYGCGCSHPSGLHLQSHWDTDGVHLLCRHTPDATFTGWPGLVYGGLLAMLVDCHSNWTAMACHYRAEGREAGSLPRIDCVTGQLGLTYLKPTPMGVELLLKARVEGEVGRKSRVICEVWAGDVLTVLADSVFVRVDTEQLKLKAHQQG